MAKEVLPSNGRLGTIWQADHDQQSPRHYTSCFFCEVGNAALGNGTFDTARVGIALGVGLYEGTYYTSGLRSIKSDIGHPQRRSNSEPAAFFVGRAHPPVRVRGLVQFRR